MYMVNVNAGRVEVCRHYAYKERLASALILHKRNANKNKNNQQPDNYIYQWHNSTLVLWLLSEIFAYVTET